MDNSLFCPIAQQACKKNECMMWGTDFCLINVYLFIKITESPSYKKANNNQEKDIELDKVEQLKQIFTKTPLEYGEEILQFAHERKLVRKNSTVLPVDIFEIFWNEKGWNKGSVSLPQEYHLLVKESWLIANSLLSEESGNFIPTIGYDQTETIEDQAKKTEESLEGKTNILEVNNEILVDQMLAFISENDLGKHESIDHDYEMVRLFWESRGVDEYHPPVEVAIKMKQVLELAKKKQIMLRENPILSKSDEELSQELATYLLINYVDVNDSRWSHTNSTNIDFWKKKGYSPYIVHSQELEQKRSLVDGLAQELLHKELEERKKARVEKEKEKLPEMIQACVEWAMENHRNTLIQGDIDYFISLKKLDILNETKRELFLGVKFELKKK